MGYRTATPPERSPEEEELSKLAEKGRRMRSGQDAEARQAALAKRDRDQAYIVAQDKARLRKLGRQGSPWRAPLVLGASIIGLSSLGGYLFYHSSLHAAIWINLMFWLVVLPSVLPGLWVERQLALRAGLRHEAQQDAWANAHGFAIVGLPWDLYDHKSEVKIEVHFKARKPEPKLLADAARAVSSEVRVDVVAILGELPDGHAEPPRAGLFDDEAESLTDMRAQSLLSASGGGLVLLVRHRHNHGCENWLESWMCESVDTAFRTLHGAYPIDSLIVRR